MNKAFKFRLYPNTEQKVVLAKTFGCCRFIFNKMLADKIAYYKSTGKMLYCYPSQYNSVKMSPSSKCQRISFAISRYAKRFTVAMAHICGGTI